MKRSRVAARRAILGLVALTSVVQGCAGEEIPHRELDSVSGSLLLALGDRPAIFVASDLETFSSWFKPYAMDPLDVPVDFSSEIFVLVWRPDLDWGYIPGLIDRVTVHDRTVVLHEAERWCPAFNPFGVGSIGTVAFLALPAEYADHRFRYRYPVRLRSPYDCGDGT